MSSGSETGALRAVSEASELRQAVPFDSGLWRFEAGEHRLEEHLGRPSLRLRGGIATVAEARFADGEIEFDLAFTGERGFVGGVWRVQDARNYEEFYLRPHQSGNPDANQYTPVFHGLAGWQLYHGARYSVPQTYRFDQWMRVRIAFSGLQAEVTFDGAEGPALLVDGLKRAVEPGAVGVSALPFAPAWFSNFSYVARASQPLRGARSGPEPSVPGIVPAWWVSDTFAESALRGRREIGEAELAERLWTLLPAEPSGLANLARVQGIERRRNTVFALATLVSEHEHEQTARLDLGFSDRARVYLNGRLLFAGNETSQSRDYRFLGSIGYFAALYLRLSPGENHLVVAVSEDLGGWGVQAKLEDLPEIKIKNAGPRSPF